MKKIFSAMLMITWVVCADAISQENEANKPAFHEYHNRIAVFGPLHQTYERIKPNAFYAGVEAWLVGAFSNDKGSCAALLGEAEVRFGYNFFWNGRDHLTPFAGGGVLRDFEEEHIDHRHIMKPAVGYGVIGFLYDHEFNAWFNLGCNVKGLVGGAGHNRLSWGSPIVGVDVALPITFRFGYHKRWDVRLEPFDLYLHGTQLSRNYVGGRSTIGYRF